MPAIRSPTDRPANLQIPQLDEPTPSSSPSIPAKRLKRSDSGELSAAFEEAVRSSNDNGFLLSPVAASTEDIGASYFVAPLFTTTVLPCAGSERRAASRMLVV
jgi:hypothetical protein